MHTGDQTGQLLLGPWGHSAGLFGVRGCGTVHRTQGKRAHTAGETEQCEVSGSAISMISRCMQQQQDKVLLWRLFQWASHVCGGGGGGAGTLLGSTTASVILPPVLSASCRSIQWSSSSTLSSASNRPAPTTGHRQRGTGSCGHVGRRHRWVCMHAQTSIVCVQEAAPCPPSPMEQATISSVSDAHK